MKSTKNNALIVDDDELIRDLMRDIFESAGYTVYSFASGEEALAFLSDLKIRIKIVLVDYDLKTSTGAEIINYVF